MAYIDRDLLLKDIAESVVFSVRDAKTSPELRGARKIIDRIENAPTAYVVEVVRCKNCAYFIPDSELDHEEYPNCIEADGLCDNADKYTDATDFCSCGERITQKKG